MAKSFSDTKLDAKYLELAQAVTTFEKSLGIDISKFDDDIECDTIKNGQIQTFEYSLELSWKFLKSYLRIEKGIDSQGPKDVFREFATFGFFTPREVTNLLKMIDDRNKVAHEYKDYIMENIYPNLTKYKILLKKLIDIWA
jgi:nucleotidyltransferase substrate binding protein (TIGR01987 family)